MIISVLNPMQAAARLVLIPMALLPASAAAAQSQRSGAPPTAWLAASVGFGSIYQGSGSSSGASADIGAGALIRGRTRLGARVVRTSTWTFGDVSTWSAKTLLAVAGRTFDSLVTISTGVGRTFAREHDSPVRGAGTVLETGVEFFSPPRHGPSWRMFILRTWALGDATWRNSTFELGGVSQFHLGVGFVFH